MDNIDRIMKEADRLGFGVSYGKYRAAYPEGSNGVAAPAVKTDLDAEQNSRQCKLCGKKFISTRYNQVYCSAVCSDEGQRRRQREFERNRKRREMENNPRFCRECGARIIETTRKLYCSDKCAKEARGKSSADWARKQSAGQLATKPVLAITCSFCGAKFQTQDRRRKTCSSKCAVEMRRKSLTNWHARRKED